MKTNNLVAHKNKNVFDIHSKCKMQGIVPINYLWQYRK